MAKDKKGFVLYVDMKSTFDKLSDEKAGKLIKHIFAYVNDENPECKDFIIEIAFEHIKQQLKRDLKKYEKTCNKNRENVLKRWNKKDTSAYERIPIDTKHTDIDKDKDKDSDSIIITSAVQLKKLLNTLSKDKIDEMIELTMFNGNLEDVKLKFTVEFIGRYGLNKTFTEAIEALQSWMSRDRSFKKDVKINNNSLEIAAEKTRLKFEKLNEKR